MRPVWRSLSHPQAVRGYTAYPAGDATKTSSGRLGAGTPSARRLLEQCLSGAVPGTSARGNCHRTPPLGLVRLDDEQMNR